MIDQLLYRLNSILGRRIISAIDFVIDPGMIANMNDTKTAPAPRPLSEFPPEIIAAASNIHDAKLRRAFLGAANSCLARLKHRATAEE
jgi:hypothetical protein